MAMMLFGLSQFSQLASLFDIRFIIMICLPVFRRLSLMLREWMGLRFSAARLSTLMSPTSLMALWVSTYSFMICQLERLLKLPQALVLRGGLTLMASISFG